MMIIIIIGIHEISTCPCTDDLVAGDTIDVSTNSDLLLVVIVVSMMMMMTVEDIVSTI